MTANGDSEKPVDALLQSLYDELLAGDSRDQAKQTVEPADKALADVQARFEDELDDTEQELQSATQELEDAQSALSLLEEEATELGFDPDPAAVEKAKAQHSDASKVVEQRMAERAEKAAAYAAARSAAASKRLDAIRDAIREFGTPSLQQQLVELGGDAPNPSPSLPSLPSPTTPTSPSPSSPPIAGGTRYEALQAEHVDLVIRVGGSFAKLGIKLDANGVVTSAPAALFDKDYTVLGIDGKRFQPGLESADGTHNVVLRCKKADILNSLSRVPPKLVKGKALKLMQVKITPGGQGFGIDLSEVNTIAGLVKGGKAEAADIRVGDIIVAADGVNIGGKRLVEVLQKGKASYIFTVIRPAAPTSQDSVDTPGEAPHQAAAPAAPASAAPAPQPPAEANGDDDQLKRSLAESLGRLQVSTEMLAGPSVRILRTTPADETGITVEWALRPDSPRASHYHLQWKLAQDAEWTQTDASRSIKATLVTKGNLKKDGLYQFRVRACSKDSNEWGTWCTPSVPVCPDGVDDALSTIAEEASDVASSVAPSVPAATRSSNGLSMEAVQGILADQRQALETQASEKLRSTEQRLAAELEAAQAELADWKAKFMEAAANSMQAVVDAKEETRAEVMKEVDAESKAAQLMKAEAADSVALIREAQRVAEEAKAEKDEYIARFENIKSEAKAETDKEAEAKLQVVMRNNMLEIRDKVKFVEQQTEGHVKRAVDEAVREERAKAESFRRALQKELEEAHEQQLLAMQSTVGAVSMKKIGEFQETQEGRKQQAVQEAVAQAKEEAARAEALAVQVAVANAVEETEARMIARQAKFEHQLQAITQDANAKLSSMYTDEAVEALVRQARQEALQSKDAAVREAAERVEQKAAVEKERMMEGVALRIRSEVREREKELLAEEGRALHQLAESELKEASKLVRYAGATASEQYGAGNDEFEEEVLKSTRPATLFGPDELLNATAKPTKTPKAKGRHDELTEHVSPKTGTKPSKNGDDEEMAVPPLEYIRMKARHAMEEKALLARQEADEYHEAERAESEPDVRRVGRAKRTAEKEGLKARQLKEAMDAGKALAYEDRAREAIDDRLNPLDHTDALAMLRSSGNDADIRKMSGAHPALKAALEKVQDLEEQVHALSAQSDGANGLARGENKKSAEQVALILQKGEVGIANTELEGIKEVMELLRKHQVRGKAMKNMLDDVSPSTADAGARETAANVQQDIEREEDIIGALAGKLQALMMRDSSAALTADESGLLRKLTVELKHQQEQAEMREAQIAWLQAESKRARITAVLEARAELEKLHTEAVSYEQLSLPTPPIAAAEDAFSVAVDWLPPESGMAVRYHLQWRVQGESKWTSSSASEQIKVPCCTKGHLKTSDAYEFRVRAADSDGVWGPWSKPTHATQPNVLVMNAPSRPVVRALSKGRVDVHWSPPEQGPKVTNYELQWRRVDGRWGESGCSMETSEDGVTSPSLDVNSFYTFRVRASLSRFRGKEWTDFSPLSGPVHPSTKDPETVRKEAKRAAKALKKSSSKPLANDADASETVIMGEIRTAAKSYHPTAQAAVEAHLQKLGKKRAQDDANVQVLEQRNEEIATKLRMDKVHELTKIKQGVMHRVGDISDDAVLETSLQGIQGSQARNNVDSWD